MILTIGIMLAGILVGILVRHQPKILKISSKLTEFSIYLLLFFLGVGVGSNQKILQNFDKIGLSVVLITVSAVLGSVLVAYLVYKFLFRKE